MRNSHLRISLSRLIRKLRSSIIFFLHSWQSSSILPIERWKERWIEFIFYKKRCSALRSFHAQSSKVAGLFSATIQLGASIIASFRSIFRIIWAMRTCSPCNLVHASFFERYKFIHLIQMSLQFIIVGSCQFLCKLIKALQIESDCRQVVPHSGWSETFGPNSVGGMIEWSISWD